MVSEKFQTYNFSQDSCASNAVSVIPGTSCFVSGRCKTAEIRTTRYHDVNR